MKWTEDRQRLLADLSAQGLSAGQIAERVGATKDQVASAMSRYGLFAGRQQARVFVPAAMRAAAPVKRGRGVTLARLNWEHGRKRHAL